MVKVQRMSYDRLKYYFGSPMDRRASICKQIISVGFELLLIVELYRISSVVELFGAN